MFIAKKQPVTLSIHINPIDGNNETIALPFAKVHKIKIKLINDHVL